MWRHGAERGRVGEKSGIAALRRLQEAAENRREEAPRLIAALFAAYSALHSLAVLPTAGACAVVGAGAIGGGAACAGA